MFYVGIVYCIASKMATFNRNRNAIGQLINEKCYVIILLYREFKVNNVLWKIPHNIMWFSTTCLGGQDVGIDMVYTISILWSKEPDVYL